MTETQRGRRQCPQIVPKRDPRERPSESIVPWQLPRLWARNTPLSVKNNQDTKRRKTEPPGETRGAVLVLRKIHQISAGHAGLPKQRGNNNEIRDATLRIQEINTWRWKTGDSGRDHGLPGTWDGVWPVVGAQ